MVSDSTGDSRGLPKISAKTLADLGPQTDIEPPNLAGVISGAGIPVAALGSILGLSQLSTTTDNEIVRKDDTGKNTTDGPNAIKLALDKMPKGMGQQRSDSMMNMVPNLNDISFSRT